MDESGSPKPTMMDSVSYFALGGVLVRRNDEERIHKQVSDFKRRWKIPDSVPLHGSEIRSRKKGFAWLGRKEENEQNAFFQDLTDTIAQCPILVHGCIVSRQGYLDRYLEKYGINTWEMMKSSLSILLERVSKYALLENGKVMVFFETAGKKEDRLMKRYFNELRTAGAPFQSSTSSKYLPLVFAQLQKTMAGIEGKTKTDPIMQIADLCLYPIAKSKEQPANRAFQSLVDNKKLIDTVLPSEVLGQMGIKYYCFDSPV
jgi:hypothetical protein